jgi:hypothetical protein
MSFLFLLYGIEQENESEDDANAGYSDSLPWVHPRRFSPPRIAWKQNGMMQQRTPCSPEHEKGKQHQANSAEDLTSKMLFRAHGSNENWVGKCRKKRRNVATYFLPSRRMMPYKPAQTHAVLSARTGQGETAGPRARGNAGSS